VTLGRKNVPHSGLKGARPFYKGATMDRLMLVQLRDRIGTPSVDLATDLDEIDSTLFAQDILIGKVSDSEYGSGDVIFPDEANEVTHTSGAGAWAKHANYTQVVADSGAKPLTPIGFYCTGVVGIHQCAFGVGGAASETALTNFVCSAIGFVPFRPGTLIAANQRLSINTSSKVGGEAISGFLICRKAA